MTPSQRRAIRDIIAGIERNTSNKVVRCILKEHRSFVSVQILSCFSGRRHVLLDDQRHIFVGRAGGMMLASRRRGLDFWAWPKRWNRPRGLNGVCACWYEKQGKQEIAA